MLHRLRNLAFLALVLSSLSLSTAPATARASDCPVIHEETGQDPPWAAYGNYIDQANCWSAAADCCVDFCNSLNRTISSIDCQEISGTGIPPEAALFCGCGPPNFR